jgi:sporulation protein YlmC with PRC-barrel domain
MLKKLGYVGLIGGALMAFPALAQAADDSFVKEQAMNQWRASKLVGVSVMGADQKKIGRINDVLFDHDGNAQVIVIGVGGFLGMGAKDVGVPFKTMQWRTEGRTVATAGPPAAATGAGANSTTSPAGTTKTDPAATEASQGYPDMGVLNMTKEQLQSAPDFHYAASPTADAGPSATPPAANAPAADSPMTQKPMGGATAPAN